MATPSSSEVGISPVLLQAITQTLGSNKTSPQDAKKQHNNVVIEDEIVTSEDVIVKCEPKNVHGGVSSVAHKVSDISGGGTTVKRDDGTGTAPGMDVNMGSVLSAIAAKLTKKESTIPPAQPVGSNPTREMMSPTIAKIESGSNAVRYMTGVGSYVVDSNNFTTPGEHTIIVSSDQDVSEMDSCPVCGDKISGYHYGIYTCESCKGFFKRTVQNKKSFMCHLTGECSIDIITRKKCPACRFKKCLDSGMKLEAIRTDRTRGGRSSYAGAQLCKPPRITRTIRQQIPTVQPNTIHVNDENNKLQYVLTVTKSEIQGEDGINCLTITPTSTPDYNLGGSTYKSTPAAPRYQGSGVRSSASSSGSVHGNKMVSPVTPSSLDDLLQVEALMLEDDSCVDGVPSCCEGKLVSDDPDMFASLLHLADHCLYKIVKWARNLPNFVNVPTDDQILLLQNSWSELLCLCVCWHSLGSTGELLLLHGRKLSMERADMMGITDIVERMLNFVAQLKRLDVDVYEFVTLKVMLLMTPDVSGLKNAALQRSCQDKLLYDLMLHTQSHYPHNPNKLYEMLARLPEVSRISQLGRERLLSRHKSGDIPQYSLLSELLKGDIGGNNSEGESSSTLAT